MSLVDQIIVKSLLVTAGTKGLSEDRALAQQQGDSGKFGSRRTATEDPHGRAKAAKECPRFEVTLERKPWVAKRQPKVTQTLTCFLNDRRHTSTMSMKDALRCFQAPQPSLTDHHHHVLPKRRLRRDHG